MLFFLSGLPLSAIAMHNHLSRPTRCTRYIDQSSFIPIATRTHVYKFSFFPRTVNDWNSAQAEVRLKLSSPSDESLKLFD